MIINDIPTLFGYVFPFIIIIFTSFYVIGVMTIQMRKGAYEHYKEGKCRTLNELRNQIRLRRRNPSAFRNPHDLRQPMDGSLHI